MEQRRAAIIELSEEHLKERLGITGCHIRLIKTGFETDCFEIHLRQTEENATVLGKPVTLPFKAEGDEPARIRP